MYGILNNGTIISLCDEPRYVKISETNGCYVQCSKEEAIALSVNGILYNINEEKNIQDAPQAMAIEIDAPEYIFNNKKELEQNTKYISEIEDAICDLDSTKEDRLTDIENALCELDNLINGGNI